MAQQFGTRRTKNKAETRRIIFDTAFALFEEKGYEKVTMRELAAKAGVGIGTIFQHFKDKSTLLVSVFEHEFHPLVNQVFASLPPDDLPAQLIYMVRHFYTYYAQRPNISRILIKELYIDPKNAERIRHTFEEDIARVAALFEAARRRGDISRKTNPENAALLWWSYYSTVLLQALQAPTVNVEEQMALYTRLQEQHFSGIAD